MATMDPFTAGMTRLKINGNQPVLMKVFSFLPLEIPISSKKIARNPLKISVVNGRMPSACFALVRNPITKLPRMINTLPLVKECFIAERFCMRPSSPFWKMLINKRPATIAGDSIIAMIATMWPCTLRPLISR